MKSPDKTKEETANVYVRDFIGGNEPEENKLSHIAILFDKFKISVQRECLLNNEKSAFDKTFIKLKERVDISREDIRLLQQFATWMQVSLSTRLRLADEALVLTEGTLQVLPREGEVSNERD